MKRRDDRWVRKAAISIVEYVAVAIGLLLTIAVGLIPAVALFIGVFVCAFSTSTPVMVRVAGCIILLLASALFSLATGYMFFASFSGGGAKAYTQKAGRMFAGAFFLLPKPVKGAARSACRAATSAARWAARALEVTLVVVTKAAVWIVLVAIAIGLAILLFQGVAALPLSVAVIIGALIIAAALQS
jgi:hypothetical protein